VNPVTQLVDAARGLMEGNASGEDILLVLAIAAAITAVFLPLTTRLYRYKG
jgi:ABC-2 type transport system permease protein